jgi:hypothetical protein
MQGLLFYDPRTGQGEFYTTPNGRIGRTRLHIGWRTGWRQIIPGNFGGDGFTDLLFYEPSTGTGEFYSTDGRGRIRLLATHTNWRHSWTQIIPGNFGGSSFTDLLFYDASAGTGEFYTTNGSGGITQIAQHTNWRGSWTQIVPGNFGGNSFTDLLFYDASAGTGEFYTTNGRGGITQIASHTNWRGSWTQIVPGNFGGDGFTDLLFYDAGAHTGEFYATNGRGGISQLALHTNWRSSWNRIVPGNFGGNGATDLLFYDAAANTGEFYTTNGRGGISHLRTYTDWRSSWTQIVPGEFASETNCMVVHFKSLLPITPAITAFFDAQYAAMFELFARSGVTVLRGANEDLSGNPNLAALLNLNVGTCTLGNPTQDHRDLMANRNNAGATHVVVYLVQTLMGGGGNLLGCATHPDGQPGAAIIQGGTNADWLTAHEVGHVLGLRHVCNRPTAANPNPPNPCIMGSNQRDSLMFPTVSGRTQPPNIATSEENTMRGSGLTNSCL